MKIRRDVAWMKEKEKKKRRKKKKRREKGNDDAWKIFPIYIAFEKYFEKNLI